VSREGVNVTPKDTIPLKLYELLSIIIIIIIIHLTGNFAFVYCIFFSKGEEDQNSQMGGRSECTNVSVRLSITRCSHR
jgi:flagellar basal body-associated protein FliL